MPQDAKQKVAANETIAKFGYPYSLLADYEHWTVLLRPQQVTLGALVLACREPATRFSDISPGAFASLAAVVADIEAALGQAFSYDKLNYLMLIPKDVYSFLTIIGDKNGVSDLFQGLGGCYLDKFFIINE